MDLTMTIWSLFNLVLLGLFAALPIWLVYKVRSLDRRLEELERRIIKDDAPDGAA